MNCFKRRSILCTLWKRSLTNSGRSVKGVREVCTKMFFARGNLIGMLILLDGCAYHIKTTPLLICTANQWNCFYMIGISVMKELMKNMVMLASLISWPLFTSGNLSRKSLKNHAIAIFIFLNWLFDNWRHSKNELLISHCFQKCIFIRSANNNALLTAIVNKIEILLSAIVAQISAISLFFSQLEEVNFSKNDFLWQLATFHHYYLLLSLKKR